jgi:glycosyltransferase involved in cell wall biosynthesis
MNILMINYEFPPLGGGGGIAAYKLAKGLVEKGHRVDYVTTWFDGLKKKEIVDGIHVFRVKVIGRRELPTASTISLITFPFFAYKMCKGLCKKNKYDMVHSHFALPSGVLGALISRRFVHKHILSIYGGDIYDPSKKNSPHRKWYYRKSIRWVMNNTDAVLADSLDIKKNAQKYYHPKDNITIFPLPYEPYSFKKTSRDKMGLDGHRKYCVSIGRLVERKGFDYLVGALPLLPDDVNVVIVGEGPLKDKLLDLAKMHGVSERLIMTGFVSEEKKFQYLDCSDVYVLSSLHEGFGIVLQEAMQVGLPIVATNVGGQNDFLKDRKNALIVHPGSSELLAKAIKEILNDPLMAKEFIEYNEGLIKTYHTDAIIRRYEEATK